MNIPYLRTHQPDNQQPKQTEFALFNVFVIIVFLIGATFFAYQQFQSQTDLTQAFPTSLTRPNRFFSFQARLSDSSLNPITGATNMQFFLYDSGPSTSGGTLLWDSTTCSITPDQDGIVNVSLGNDCGSELDASVFSENQNVWLQIQVAAETLSPRQLIHTVGYALCQVLEKLNWILRDCRYDLVN